MERPYLSESSSLSSSSSRDHGGGSVRLRASSRADIFVLEQLKIQRKNMSQVCKMCVKSIVDKSPFETITDDCPHLTNLCNVLEHILLHRMQARWSIFSSSDPIHFWHVIQQYASPVTVGSIDDMENVTTELGKCRAWLRLSLVQKRLAIFMNTLLNKQQELKVVYMQGALLISNELYEVAGVLKCLDAIDFNLCLRDHSFDFVERLEIDYSPYLVFHQNTSSRRDDAQEERRLLSTSSSGSRRDDDELEEEEDQEVVSLKELLKVEREQKNYYEELVSVRDTQVNQLQRELDELGRESEKEKKEMSDIIIELQEQISKLQDSLRQQQKGRRQTDTNNSNRRSGFFSSIFKSGDDD